MSRVHVSGWLEVSETSTGVDPDYGIESGERPDNSLPGGRPPHVGNKPPGRPVLPPHVDNKPPVAPAHPWLPGRWEIVDPGWGKPPLLVFFPTDPGFGIEESPVGPDNSLPGGVWIPCDPDYGIPIHGCGPSKPKPPLWGWLPKPPDFGKPPAIDTKPPDAGTKPPEGAAPKTTNY